MSYLKEHKGPTHVAARPPSGHYLKPQDPPFEREHDAAGQVIPGHFVKRAKVKTPKVEVTVNEADAPVE